MHYRRGQDAQPLRARASIVRDCSVTGCKGELLAKGLCAMHYSRVRTSGDVGGAASSRNQWCNNKGSECSVIGCGKPSDSKGLCSMHYNRVRSGGGLGSVGSSIMRNKGIMCSITGCGESARSRGLCKAHYGAKRKEWTGECSVDGCGRPVQAKGLCDPHYERQKKGKSLASPIKDGSQPIRYITAEGYVKIDVPKGTAGAQKGRKRDRMAEHRYVMQEALGRPLLSHESAHHVNGNRADNRIDNLELWSSSQPPGQRVADKVAWSIETMTLYLDYIGLDLVDQAALKAILDRVKRIGEQSATRKRSARLRASQALPS